jgi:hypothetical protein
VAEAQSLHATTTQPTANLSIEGGHYTDQIVASDPETISIFVGDVNVHNGASNTSRPRSLIRPVLPPADVGYTSWFPSEPESGTESEGKKEVLVEQQSYVCHQFSDH